MWYFTIYIVTDQRIRQVTQHGFFGKDVVELRLSKIQNISYNIPGFSGECMGLEPLLSKPSLVILSSTKSNIQTRFTTSCKTPLVVQFEHQGEHEEITE